MNSSHGPHSVKNVAGVKLHALLDHDGHIPAFLEITDARKHESQIAKALTLPKGSIVVFDRGYVCYRWFAALIQAGVFFVTRQKKNMSYKVLERRPVNKKLGLTSDQIIQVMSGGKPLKLRRVGYRDAKTGKHFVYLTSHFTLSARTIAEIYKDRLQIEIFFRLIKQNLKIKRFHRDIKKRRAVADLRSHDHVLAGRVSEIHIQNRLVHPGDAAVAAAERIQAY